jgi:large subunit ribosomal protein L13
MLYNLYKSLVVNTLSYKTKSLRKQDVQRKWYVVDAEGEIVGRLAVKIANVLRGKHKPDFTPHTDGGDNIIVINAEKIRFTGAKLDQKEYDHYTGYPNGRKVRNAAEMLEKQPHKVLEKAVKGMIPKNKLGNAIFTKLYVYAGPEHNHHAQKPEPLKFN